MADNITEKAKTISSDTVLSSFFSSLISGFGDFLGGMIDSVGANGLGNAIGNFLDTASHIL